MSWSKRRMAEQRLDQSPDDLEQALHHIGQNLDWPAEANLLPGFRERLAIASPRRSRVPRLRHTSMPARLGWVTAALVLIVALVLTVSGSTRNTFADRLGLSGVSITTDPTATITPGSTLHLGVQTTLDDAISRSGGSVVMPPSDTLGTPDAVYVLEQDGVIQVSYIFLPRPDLPEAGDTGVGLMISQFDGSTNESFIQKQLGPDTTIEQVEVNGQPAFWLGGAPHVFYYESPDGEIHEETIRLAANVLLWEQGGKTLRIESLLDRGAAVKIAESMSAYR
jgi:hypothetical protein